MSHTSASTVDKSVVLIGFMGVGKTTIGEVVAKKLGRPFIDVDVEIEKTYNMPVPEIFALLGEETFRNMEREITIQHCMSPGKVISLGGGAFLNEEIRSVCLAHCTVFCLNVSWDTWQKDRYQKISESRPLLQGKTSDEIKQMYDKRKPVYAVHHYNFPLDRFDLNQASDVIVESVYREMLRSMESEESQGLD